MHKRRRFDEEATDEAADSKRRRSSLWSYLASPLSKLSSWMRASGDMGAGVSAQGLVSVMHCLWMLLLYRFCPSAAAAPPIPCHANGMGTGCRKCWP